MKKIPTLFVRIFDEQHHRSITREITPGMEWVLEGEGIATVKMDGSCCAIIGGIFFKRYDAKNGKQPPDGAIACCEPDSVTGHWPHWMPVDSCAPENRWYWEAYRNTQQDLEDGTYEAIGPHFLGNPYGLEKDILVRHGTFVVEVSRTYDGLKAFLQATPIEGLVFWDDRAPQCKIKRSDFGLAWPIPEAAAYYRKNIQNDAD